jgi:hypothetical protein
MASGPTGIARASARRSNPVRGGAYHRLAVMWTLANLAWAAIFAGAIASLAVR